MGTGFKEEGKSGSKETELLLGTCLMGKRRLVVKQRNW